MRLSLRWCLLLLGGNLTFSSRLFADVEEMSDNAESLNESMTETTKKPPLFLLAAVPWLMAGGATYTAVTAADYYSQLDAASKFSYMQLPVAATCLVSNASTSSGFFVSRATQRVSDPWKCSLCHSFISGMIDKGVAELPTITSSRSFIFSLPSAFRHNDSSDLTQEISNMTRDACKQKIDSDDEFTGDGSTMLDQCQAQGVELLKLHPQILDKLKLITRATTRLSGEFIANAICEDLQCCPQRPVVAEMIANLAASQTDVQTLKSHGALGALLDKPEAEVMLEGVEEKLVFEELARLEEIDDQRTLVVDSEDNSGMKPAIATNCEWSYRKAQCMPKDLCSYQYKFGDLTLSHSCRAIKPTPPKEPSTDEECVWNRALMKCSMPEFCSRQCRFDDTDLNGCCRLSAEDSEEEHHEESAKNCGGEDDLERMSRPDTPQQLDSIGTASFSVWNMNIDPKKSLKGHKDIGFSERCASCFVAMSACVIKKCFTLVAANKTSDASKECIKNSCQQALLTCSGVREDQLPKEQSDQ